MGTAVRSVVDWMGSVGRRVRDSDIRGTPETETDPRPGPRSSLFQCPACETVYVAIDKASCRECDAAVTRVPSTLSEET